MSKIALVLVKNVCFDVKKGISELGVLGNPKTYCYSESHPCVKPIKEASYNTNFTLEHVLP